MRHRAPFVVPLVITAFIAGAVPAAAGQPTAATRRFAGGTTAASVTDPDDVDTPLDIGRAAVGGDAATATFSLFTWDEFADLHLQGTAFFLDVNRNGSADYAVVAGYDPDAGAIRAEVVALPSFSSTPASASRVNFNGLVISASRGAIGGRRPSNGRPRPPTTSTATASPTTGRSTRHPTGPGSVWAASYSASPVTTGSRPPSPCPARPSTMGRPERW